MGVCHCFEVHCHHFTFINGWVLPQTNVSKLKKVGVLLKICRKEPAWAKSAVFFFFFFFFFLVNGVVKGQKMTLFLV